MLPADRAVAATAASANILVTENFMGFSLMEGVVWDLFDLKWGSPGSLSLTAAWRAVTASG
jgi:hypothetical protein